MIVNFSCTIYTGLPPPPTDLVATKNGLGSLNISWSFPGREGVPVNFNVIAKNLNATSTELVNVTGLQRQHYILMVDSRLTSCDSYKITVIAENDLGRAEPSEVIATLPSIPDLSQAGDLLEQSLHRTDDGFMLTISLVNEYGVSKDGMLTGLCVFPPRALFLCVQTIQ